MPARPNNDIPRAPRAGRAAGRRRVAGRRISATWRSRPSFGDRWIEATRCSRHRLRGGGADADRCAPLHARAARAPRSRSAAAGRAPVVAGSAPARARGPRIERLNRGETLIGLLKRAGVSDQAAQEVVRAATASAVNTRYLRAGMPVDVTADSAGRIAARARVPSRHRSAAAHEALGYRLVRQRRSVCPGRRTPSSSVERSTPICIRRWTRAPRRSSRRTRRTSWRGRSPTSSSTRWT